MWLLVVWLKEGDRNKVDVGKTCVVNLQNIVFLGLYKSQVWCVVEVLHSRNFCWQKSIWISNELHQWYFVTRTCDFYEFSVLWITNSDNRDLAKTDTSLRLNPSLGLRRSIRRWIRKLQSQRYRHFNPVVTDRVF